MPKLIKVIEVLAQSETSWEDAAKNALEEAKKTLRNIRSIYVKELEAKVENDEIVEFRIHDRRQSALDEHGIAFEGVGFSR